MKRALIYISLLIILCFTLNSCSLTDEISLIRSEWSEISEFFTGGYFYNSYGDDLPNGSSAENTTAEAESAVPDKPILSRMTHVEVIPSPFNSPASTTTIASLALAEKAYTAGHTADMASFKYGSTSYDSPYIFVPYGETRMHADEAAELFGLSGAECLRVARTNTAPSGEVFAVEYAGYSDENGFYINPAVPVTLYYSAKKAATTVRYNAESSESGMPNNLVYLTFDDGPSKKNTEPLLDILDTYGIKAAFFTTGEAVKKSPELAKLMLDRGHVLGCHSVTHDYRKIYASVQSLEEEVVWWEEILRENCGIEPGEMDSLTFRFPGGSVGSFFDSYTAGEMKKMLEEHGYRVFDWNVVTNDSLLFTAPDGVSSYEYIKENFLSTFEQAVRANEGKDGAPLIVLMHETVSETVDLLPWLIETLIDRGMVFGNLADMPYSWTFADR